jgi:hypothetical protein
MQRRLWQEQTADLSTALRSGRDDKGWGRYGLQRRLWQEQTADLSTALSSGRDDKGWGCGGPQRRLWQQQTADLSTALRYGRDDKGGGRYGPQRRLCEMKTCKAATRRPGLPQMRSLRRTNRKAEANEVSLNPGEPGQKHRGRRCRQSLPGLCVFPG